jgi:hypothetical protein
MHKLGVIVPYRNRYEHLQEFKENITNYLESKNIDFEIIIVEQDDAKLFNRGMLLNIGFKYAKDMGCDYVVFHDVDMLPVDVDYSYSDVPLHLSTNFEYEEGEKERTIFDEYFGGVTLFPVKLFEDIDGYSNKYWGWGYEDNDLLLRCNEKLIPLDKLKLKNLGRKAKALKLNGINAYVKGKNIIDFKKSSFTIFVSFYPDKLQLNHTKVSDEFSAFSIPGYDFAISYTSFARYNFCAFDDKLIPHFVNSNIKTNYKTNMVLSYDLLDKTIKVFQDGIKIDETKQIKKFYKNYYSEEYFYLGVGKPDRDIIPNYFKGYIDSFAYFDSALSDSEIFEISNNQTELLTKNFGNYRSSSFLKTYYDADFIKEYKLVDLSLNDNDGEIINCEIVDLDIDDYTIVNIPHRRNGLFKSLKHEENGFLGNKWKDESTRWNQLRFQNEVSNHVSLLNRDGLSTLNFYEYGVNTEGKVTQINVAI